MDMGIYAARQALRDAGLEWGDLQFAVGGSLTGLQGSEASPDTMVGRLGLSGLPVRGCVQRLRHRGFGTGDRMQRRSRPACATTRFVVGFDKHPPGAFDPDPSILGLGKWYGDIGLMLTTQFFAMKLNRYMHDFGITESTLAKVAAKNFRNGVVEPERLASEAVQRGGDRSRRGC